MSVVQKVVILNKPLKILEFTPVQWVMMVFSACAAFIIWQKTPSEWKLGNLPAGFLFGLLVVCAAIVFVKATEIKPAKWWVNVIFYRLKFWPSRYLPHPEPAPDYPDATIIDAPKRNETSEFFIGEDPGRTAYKG
jgi:hypothetical protein